MRFVIARRRMTFPRQRALPCWAAGWLFALFLVGAGTAMVVGLRELRHSGRRSVDAVPFFGLLRSDSSFGMISPGSDPPGTEEPPGH